MGPQPIRSKSKVYPVGQRGSYVYHLVSGIDPDAGRQSVVDRYTAQYELTREEQEQLTIKLRALDDRRAKPKPEPKTAPEWMAEAATDKQREYLAKLGIECPATKGEASRLIYKANTLKSRDDKLSVFQFQELQIGS
jgi:pyruvate formate-lyase activating enzyme-like uncharacterized protein